MSLCGLSRSFHVLQRLLENSGQLIFEMFVMVVVAVEMSDFSVMFGLLTIILFVVILLCFYDLVNLLHVLCDVANASTQIFICDLENLFLDYVLPFHLTI